jgi:stress-induced morphogen
MAPALDEVKQRIEAALPGARATVSDLTGGGDHLRAEVVYDGFAGLSRIEQHRLVYDVFQGEIGGAIHALSIKTVIPSAGNDGSSELSDLSSEQRGV